MSCVWQNEEQLESGSDGEKDAAISDDEIPEGIDLNDPYFQEEYKQLEKAEPDKQKKNKKRKGKKSQNEGDKLNGQEQVLVCVESSSYYSLLPPPLQPILIPALKIPINFKGYSISKDTRGTFFLGPSSTILNWTPFPHYAIMCLTPLSPLLTYFLWFLPLLEIPLCIFSQTRLTHYMIIAQTLPLSSYF